MRAAALASIHNERGNVVGMRTAVAGVGDDALTEITLSIVVTAHSEGRLLRPTLRSVAVAIDVLVENSVACELLFVLDNATEATTRETEYWLQEGRVGVPVRSVTTSFADAGASRDAGALNAHGRFVAFCDGDDLVSSHYLADAMAVLADAAAPVILHPETIVSFGARALVWTVPASESASHLDLIRHNLWPSASISLRSTYLDHPYASPKLVAGMGPEDWLWNIHTSIAGIPHRPVPGSMFFYRVRESGGVNNSHRGSILPDFDLDGLIEAMPVLAAPNPEESESRFAVSRLKRGLRAAVLRRARATAHMAFRPMSASMRARMLPVALRAYRRLTAPTFVSSDVTDTLLAASELEPALSWTAHQFSTLPTWSPPHDDYATLLTSLVEQLRGKADALVAVPWVGIGGADIVSLNYAKALAASSRYAGSVSMLATYTPSRTLRHLVPEGVNFVQVPESFRELSPELQRRLLAQVLLMVRPSVIVSINCFDITNSLQLFSGQLTSTSRIFLSLFAFDRIGEGYPVNPITDDPQREFLDGISGIITDNSVTAAIVEEMLGLDGAKVNVQHQPAMDAVPEMRVGSRAYNNRYFSAANPFRVVWPHRLDKEKRPESLVKIARKLRELDLPVEIHVHGQQVLSENGKALMKSLAGAGIKYHGPYSGGLTTLPTHDYHALLLTSESEGLPLVLVQSMLLGLPVIATKVGGVVDIVRDKETGMLAADPDDVDGFVDAIRYLMDSLEDRQRIIRAAYEFAVLQHSWPTFTKLVEDTLA